MPLHTGDVIKMGVTHQVTINGDNSWIRLDIESQVQHNESSDDAYARVDKELQAKIISAMESTAKTVIDYEKGK
mgnify:CR=1 FL=1